MVLHIDGCEELVEGDAALHTFPHDNAGLKILEIIRELGLQSTMPDADTIRGYRFGSLLMNPSARFELEYSMKDVVFDEDMRKEASLLLQTAIEKTQCGRIPRKRRWLWHNHMHLVIVN